VGTGFIALLALQVLRAMGFNPVAVARRLGRKAERIRRLGFRVLVGGEAVEAAAAETVDGLGYDMVFEASGSNGPDPGGGEGATPRRL